MTTRPSLARAPTEATIFHNCAFDSSYLAAVGCVFHHCFAAWEVAGVYAICQNLSVSGTTPRCHAFVSDCSDVADSSATACAGAAETLFCSWSDLGASHTTQVVSLDFSASTATEIGPEFSIYLLAECHRSLLRALVSVPEKRIFVTGIIAFFSRVFDFDDYRNARSAVRRGRLHT